LGLVVIRRKAHSADARKIAGDGEDVERYICIGSSDFFANFEKRGRRRRRDDHGRLFEGFEEVWRIKVRTFCARK